MAVLVTGGAGYIGSHMVLGLLSMQVTECWSPTISPPVSRGR